MSSCKGAILDERGNTFTSQWENYDSYIREDPLYKELIKTIKVEVAKNLLSYKNSKFDLTLNKNTLTKNGHKKSQEAFSWDNF